MNDILRIACLKIALQRAFLGRAILRVIDRNCFIFNYLPTMVERPFFTIVFCGSD